MARHTLAEDRERARQAKAARLAERSARMQAAVVAAPTNLARMDKAYDWLRASSTRLGKSPASHPESERVMAEVAGYLAQVAAVIDGRLS